jgi:hypothetical protein
LDPDDTLSDPIPIVKEDGWALDQRPPARIMNYLQNLFSEWLKRYATTPVNNWLLSTDVGAASVDAIVYSGDADGTFKDGLWFLFVGVDVFSSEYGVDWTDTGTNLTSAANPGAVSKSDSYKAIIGTANGLEYNSGGFTFVEVTNATIGGGGGFTGGAIALDANGDRTIVVDTLGNMRIAATGVNGAWSAPTTPPDLGAVAGTVGRVVYGGGTKWYAARRSGTAQKLASSDDDGDTWTSRTLPTFLSNNVNAIAYDPDSARLVACGEDIAGTAPIQYSDDDGATWTPSAFEGLSRDDTIDVYSLGAGIWVGIQNSRIVFSQNNAVTFAFADQHELPVSVSQEFLVMWGDGRKLAIGGENGLTARSLSFPKGVF